MPKNVSFGRKTVSNVTVISERDDGFGNEWVIDDDGRGQVNLSATAAGSTTPTTVGASSITLIAANSTRKAAVIENTDSAKDLYISLSSPALTTHHHLNPGDTFSIDNYTGAVYAIASDAGTNVCYTEVG